MSENVKTSGVQDLIDRLSQDGVAEGQRQASQIVKDAERKADGILQAARRQADEILQKARQEADRMQSAGQEALKLAARDTIRGFNARIHDGFRNHLQQLVGHELQDPRLMKSMILEITRQATEGLTDKRVDVVIPRQMISDQEARQQIEAGEHDALTAFVLGLIGEDLRQGATISLGSDAHSGLVIRVIDEKLEIDLTEEALAEFLSLHLLPRFRAIMG